MATCKGRKKDGTPCRARIVLDNGYCRAHQEQAEPGDGGKGTTRWTREKLEAAIEANGGPEGLDLAGEDLSNVDLSEMDLRGIVFGGTDEVAGGWRPANLTGAFLARWDGERREWRRADLRGAALCGVDLTNVLGLKHAILSDADLRCTDLRRVDLREAVMWRADLRGARLSGAKLQRAQLQGACLSGEDTDLTEAKLQRAWLGKASLRSAELVSASLRGASLVDADIENAVLWEADLRDAYFVRCSLRGADLRGSKLAGVDLRRVADNGLREVYLHNALLCDTRLKTVQLEPGIGDETRDEKHWLHYQAREAYENLKRNFEALGDHDGALWSYIKARQSEKVCSTPWFARRFYGRQELGDSSKRRLSAYHPRVWWFYIRHTTKWLKDWLTELVCNYGEGPWRTVATMAVVYLLFGALYWAGWAVVREVPRPDGIVDLVPTRDLMDIAVFGLGAFTTMDAEGVQAISPGWQVVAGVEALAGIALTGLLGFVAGNRIRRS